MPDVLDQSEVDALLAAVDEGDVSFTYRESTASTQERDVVVYDFKRPERVSKDQLRALTALHEGFARNFGASLSQFMRTIVEVKLASVEQLTYSEFILSLPNPTCFGLIECQPLEGNVILEFNPSIIYPVLDRLLGGSGDEPAIPDRPLTEIETRLVNKVYDRALEQLKLAWQNVQNIGFGLDEIESNPQLVQIVPPNEPVVLLCFEIAMANISGMMNLCLPYRTMEPVLGTFSSQSWFANGRKKGDAVSAGHIVEGLSHATVEARIFLAETSISVKDFLSLEVGDVIETHKSKDSEVLIYIGGKPKFRGKPGRAKNSKAVMITRKAESKEKI